MILSASLVMINSFVGGISYACREGMRERGERAMKEKGDVKGSANFQAAIDVCVYVS